MKWYVLDLNPEPWAIGPVGYARRGGKMSAYVGRNAQLDAYKQAVKEEFGDPIHLDMIEGKVTLMFFFWRNRPEYTTPQARTHRKHEADVTNLQKATEDALQGVLFKNDKDVNNIHSILVDQGPNVKGKIVIGITRSLAIPSELDLMPKSIWMKLEELERAPLQMELPFDDDKYSSSPELF